MLGCVRRGSWYALHTVGVRDSLDAINGIGHAAVIPTPASATRWPHTATPSTADGEMNQMREYVDAFSHGPRKSNETWSVTRRRGGRANPGQEPGPALRQKWDHQAWNDARPGKIAPRDGAEITARVARRTARARLPATRPDRSSR